MSMELKIHEDEVVTADTARLRFQPFLFAYATLVDHQTFEELSFLADESTRILSGVLASSMYTLKDPENPPNFGSFFVFPDISVRKEGVFRLKIALYRMEGNGGKKENESSEDESFSGGKKSKKAKKVDNSKAPAKNSYSKSPSYSARPPPFDPYAQPSYRPPPPGYYPNYPPYPYDPAIKPNFPPPVRPGHVPPRSMGYPDRDPVYSRQPFDPKTDPSDHKPRFPEVHEDEGPLSVLQKAAEYHSAQRAHVSSSEDFDYPPKSQSHSPNSKTDDHKYDDEHLATSAGSLLKDQDGIPATKKRRLEARPRDLHRDYTLQSVDGKSSNLPPITAHNDNESESRQSARDDEHKLPPNYDMRGSPTKSHPHAVYPPHYYRPPPYYYPYPPYNYPPHYPPKDAPQDYYRPPIPVRPKPPHDPHYPPPHYPQHHPYYPPHPGPYPPYYGRPHRESELPAEREDNRRGPYHPPTGHIQSEVPNREYENPASQATERKQWPWVKDEQ
ncbi:hypothetical protein HDV01_005707 [Terramyces sp. JEL0728]|nr:hypothetical protein HDV01_005707 [Terramyces sp. JEL0728]